MPKTSLILACNSDTKRKRALYITVTRVLKDLQFYTWLTCESYEFLDVFVFCDQSINIAPLFCKVNLKSLPSTAVST